ncbi:MAG: TonB-dependent receptor plug domain-containing protein [Gemmatimonadota bacterium]|nr:TonB-dependent receptor plug domain-containing protein [Gemmatimonadota bacterium]MDH3422175.1 TonB-dependent receptor plug domain-containing protein [Gemmatimonadota bacterium]
MSYAPSAKSLGSTALTTLLLTAALAATGPVHGQERSATSSARLQGVVVVESTFEAIIGATVSIIDTDIETQTGSLGDFAILDAPLGKVWVRVSAPGFPSVRDQVEITEDGIVFVQFRMPEDVGTVLDDVIVVVVDPDVASSEAGSALDLLAIKIPSISMRSTGSVGTNMGWVRLRGFNSITQDGNPLVVIDDVAVTGERPPLEVLSQIPANDVESIEVLRGTTAAHRYPYATNGVIVVKTKRR